VTRSLCFTSLNIWISGSCMKVLGGSKLSSRFQVTVPKSVREILNLDTGDLLMFVNDHDQIVVKRGKVKIE
jgi:AbrB family looped-hinge helix DNA binding protein